jgi:ubiquinone/menaquinone biosynthesis C-methylase UbiE
MNDEFKKEYDSRYLGDYRSQLQGYEIARWDALQHFFSKGPGRTIRSISKVLDYGAGSGLFAPLWKKLFPQAEIMLCDISTVARDLYLKKEEGEKLYGIIEDGRAPFEDNTFDLVISIEVMEHVEKLSLYLTEIFRILKPKGAFVWTTPCSNSFSIEHIYALLNRQIEKSSSGELRWQWEDKGHLRRLKSHEVAKALEMAGFRNPIFRYRAHLFSFWATRGLKMLPERTREQLMILDYRWFRNIPNGASMIGMATKQ